MKKTIIATVICCFVVSLSLVGQTQSWQSIDFDDSSWSSGPGGFGYGDGDDNTLVDLRDSGALSIYIRKVFTVSFADASRSDILRLRVDYDDGFVAYLNGVEIARGDLGEVGEFIAYDQPAGFHEAGTPVDFNLSSASQLLNAGQNVLAIQAHNITVNSSDLTIIADLSITGSPSVQLVRSNDTWRYFIGTEEPDNEPTPIPTDTPTPTNSPTPLPPTSTPSIFDTGDVIINEFAAATSDRALRWPDSGMPTLGTGTPWTSLDFNDSGWQQGAAPVGMGRRGLGTDVITNPEAHWNSYKSTIYFWKMGLGGFGYGYSGLNTGVNLTRYRGALSLYIRNVFTVSAEDAARSDPLELSVDYDDGFVAYLNGVEIARSNLGQVGEFIAHDRVATSHDAGTPDAFPLASAASLLVPGKNVLAIQVHNNRMNGSDLAIKADLIMAGSSFKMLVRQDEAWQYFLGYSEPPLAGPDSELSSIYLRKEFTMTSDQASSGTALTLGIQYDDGFVAYINGQVVARRNLGAADTFVYHDQPSQHRLERTETITLQSPSSLNLNTGTNLLAIQVHTMQRDEVDTISGDTSDIFMDAKLTGQSQTYFDYGTSWKYVSGTNEPSGGLLDERGRIRDWIELYNQSNATVSLDGWALTDDANNLDKWLFPNVSLGSGEYLVVFASGRDRRPIDGSNLHTNFRLSAEGEFLALYDANGRLASAYTPVFVPQSYFHSYGQLGSGLGYAYFEEPSPGEMNGNGEIYEGIVGRPQFSHPNGFYSGSQSVSITTETTGATIRYKTDGSTPSLSDGNTYSFSISVSSNMIIVAKAFKSGMIESELVSRTYRIGGSPNRGLPSLFVVGDRRKSIYDPAGIMAISGNGRDSSNAWCPSDPRFDYNNFKMHGWGFERPVSGAYVNPSDDSDTEFRAGFRVQGSAFFRSLATSSGLFGAFIPLRLYFRGLYSGGLGYRLYDESPIENPSAIVIRSKTTGQLARDEFSRRLLQDAGHAEVHGTFANLYINGEDKGIVDLVERLDEDFLKYYHNSGEDWDLLKFHESFLGCREVDDDPDPDHWHNHRIGALDGDTEVWDELRLFGLNNDMTQCSSYQYLESGIDFVSYIDYMLVNFYGANGDWPGHNFNLARERSDTGKIKILHWDGDFFLGGNINDNFFDKFHSNGWITWIYNLLRTNDDFKLLFADRIQALFFGDGALTTSNVYRRWDEMVAGLGVSRSVITGWDSTRRNNVLNNARSDGMWPTLSAPTFNQNGGQVSQGFSLTMSGSGTVYYTTDGSDPRQQCTGTVNDTARAYSSSIPLAGSVHVKARVQSGSTWSPISEATFQMETASPGDIIITEFLADPAGQGANREWIEIYNTTDQAININGWVIKDNDTQTHTIIAGDSLFVPAKGHFILGESIDTDLNGGVSVDYAYGAAIRLGNGNDEIILLQGSEVIHSIGYGIFNPTGDPIMNVVGFNPLEGDAVGMTSDYCNGASDSWLPQTLIFGSFGDTGTPGSTNDGVTLCDVNPTIIPTPTTCLPGDENRNGTISAMELSRAISAFRGILEPHECVDTDGSGVVSAMELSRVISAFRGTL